MQWLAQNWIWIIFAFGIFLMMRRGGMGCGKGHGHSHANDSSAQHHGNSGDRQSRDPVSGEVVDPETAINAMYKGRLYYFASRENREKFEASPTQYAASAASHPHRRHGC